MRLGACGFGYGVGESECFEVEPGENLADLGGVIDGENEAPFDLAQHISHGGKIIAREHLFAIIALTAPMGRIEVEQRVRSVQPAIRRVLRRFGFALR